MGAREEACIGRELSQPDPPLPAASRDRTEACKGVLDGRLELAVSRLFSVNEFSGVLDAEFIAGG